MSPLWPTRPERPNARTRARAGGWEHGVNLRCRTASPRTKQAPMRAIGILSGIPRWPE